MVLTFYTALGIKAFALACYFYYVQSKRREKS